MCAGNFNLTNIDELFNELLSFGQYPKEVSDTVTVMEKIGHFLDDEVQRILTGTNTKDIPILRSTSLLKKNSTYAGFLRDQAEDLTEAM